MCERLKQAVLKTALPERVTGVRIPLPPPYSRVAVRRDETLLSVYSPNKRANVVILPTHFMKGAIMGLLDALTSIAGGASPEHHGVADAQQLVAIWRRRQRQGQRHRNTAS